MGKKDGAEVYAEVGVDKGETVRQVARILPPGSEIYIFDRTPKLENVRDQLLRQGFPTIHAFANTARHKDSYNWSLMKLVKTHNQPIFDYVFLDGSHTWETDGLAFYLLDKLLKVGGYIEFDDYGWTFNGSPTVNPNVRPDVKELYSDEQLAAPQIQLVVDLLVKTNPNYVEVMKNRIYQKVQ